MKKSDSRPFKLPVNDTGNIRAIGIDIGSLYVKTVAQDGNGGPVWKQKWLHEGQQQAYLDALLEECGKSPSLHMGCAGSGATKGNLRFLDPVICLKTAVQEAFPEVRNILEVGASRLRLLRLDEKGALQSLHSNSLCAAGTGSFLDTQAARMGIEREGPDTASMGENPPSIATRCAVFAKSDLAYLQQEGYSVQAMWSGLCKGLVEGLLQTLTKGRPLEGPTVLCGGVALNRTFVGWLENILAVKGAATSLIVLKNPEFATARGAALLALDPDIDTTIPATKTRSVPARKRRPPLCLKRSRFPKADLSRWERDAQGNEITRHIPPQAQRSPMDVWLGVDIGSTSTKLALIDAESKILLDVYRRTEGNPIPASQKIFRAALETCQELNMMPIVRGAATTGGGRKLIGTVVGADFAVNELSAHTLGALQIDASVETIFEIGGQDAKYVSLKRGRMRDANMNYVCAAGTGSFVEELAEKLGFALEELGETVMGVAPPYTSSRCTVFMEQDVLALLQEGYSREEAAGAVIYSVIENYLEQVVGRRPINPDRIFFQGATARNPALAAAIENICRAEVVISPYCHVMGAYGAALYAKDRLGGRATSFRGLDLGTRRISMSQETCRLCPNACVLQRAHIEGEKESPLWGMKCGRDAHQTRRKTNPHLSLYRKVSKLSLPDSAWHKSPDLPPNLIFPRALTTYSLLPFWKALFDSLGIAYRIGGPTERDCIAEGNTLTGTEFCLPVQAAIGHAAKLSRQYPRSWIFFPHVLADYPLPEKTHTRYCPYVETLPSLLKNASGRDNLRIIAPIFDLHLSDKANARELLEALSPVASLDVKSVEAALVKAHSARREHESRLTALGRKALDDIRHKGKPVIVLVGRPYNTLDEGLNHGIPAHIAECGMQVIPMDALPFRPELLTGEFSNLFWIYGQRILSALMQVAEGRGLYAVYLSNFSCGPDSFLLTYAETIMQDKPFLALEIDEHGSTGGYQTRIEAFLEVVRSDWESRKTVVSDWTPPAEVSSGSDLKRRTIWIPPMHPVGNRLFAAVFRAHGYDARTLPQEDEATFALGKKWTRGAECLPAPLTLGTFLQQMEQERKAGVDPNRSSALFLPTSDGPCRFGQYRTLDRIVLDSLGCRDLPILSPGAHNAYYGLERKVREQLWEAILASDILFKLRCRVRPYEQRPGQTRETLEEWVDRAVTKIESGRIHWADFLADAARDFSKIPTEIRSRPLVGVVGEIYVRCNTFANSGVIEAIEDLGGEAWLSPVSEWILYTAWMERYLASRKGAGLVSALELGLKWRYLSGKEHRLYHAVESLLHDRTEPSVGEILKAGRSLLPVDFEGESILTLGRALLFAGNGADLVVNCAPFGCMHGHITSMIFEHQAEEVGIPVVNMFYDGMMGNDFLATFLHEALQKCRQGAGAKLKPSEMPTPKGL